MTIFCIPYTGHGILSAVVAIDQRQQPCHGSAGMHGDGVLNTPTRHQEIPYPSCCNGHHILGKNGPSRNRLKTSLSQIRRQRGKENRNSYAAQEAEGVFLLAVIAPDRSACLRFCAGFTRSNRCVPDCNIIVEGGRGRQPPPKR